MFPTILIIDDEPMILQSLSGLLSDEGFEVLTATNGYEGLKLIETESPDLVLLDIWMPGIDGIETLKEIKKSNPFIQVIIITGHGNVETAVRATKLGAFDMIEKPLSIDKVIVDISNALNFRRLEEENRYLRKKTIEKHAIDGHSPAISELKQQIAVVAPTGSWVLITGENGAGKELVARNIHQFSPRAEQPLIDINCAAIPDERLESELFGHEKGAVPWSENRKRGRFEMADRGTLLLDEICDMSLSTQAKLLRVLQEQKFQRVGGGRTIRINVRVIAATNRDIEAEIEKGNFREDLYYRLNEIPITVPALRNRREDIPVLAKVFLAKRAGQYGGPAKQFTAEALEMLGAYSWPGNVRELKNLINRLVLMIDRDSIGVDDIPAPCNPGAGGGEPEPIVEKLLSAADLNGARAAFEAEFIRRRLAEHGNDPEKAARVMGMSPEDLLRKLGASGGDSAHHRR
ncbi:Fis family transcriptional regulator [Desulfonema ishimotonii]|uniref:Fis family transcriptional regulator n=1 Tax=Desulfonema ishimotonii TaxID=45657 RepID=A0A401G114_9BACT|nr:sigma-54 dependent transcriptional regulator [Desulfonema ishimotonii]GBC62896.1 Fis family transcriptional regulator [Desulfonema ishimotonii]